MDLALLGGNILTMDGRDSRVEALGIERGKIVALGANGVVSKLIGGETKTVQLAGRTVIPGFIDPHNHFSLTAFQPVSVDCSVPPFNGIQEIVDAIAAAAKGAPNGQWI